MMVIVAAFLFLFLVDLGFLSILSLIFYSDRDFGEVTKGNMAFSFFGASIGTAAGLYF